MIEVVTPACPYAGFQFDEVTKWHVDENGHLHLQYPDKAGNAATFARGEWLAVYDATTDPAAPGREDEITRTREVGALATSIREDNAAKLGKAMAEVVNTIHDSTRGVRRNKGGA